jgi:4-azaleucine resistance transporter AzlC
MNGIICGMSKLYETEEDSLANKQTTFTWAGVRHGFRRTILVGVSIFAYGLVFGVLARQAGLSLMEALLMSSLVFAGSSQFAVLGLWTAPLPALTIILTTLIINLRHILMGAALRPWFSSLPLFRRYATMFLLNDESWALTMAERARGYRDAAFLLGSGIVSFISWNAATLVGGLLGNTIQDPSQWGLDFAFTAVFIALLVGLWTGKKDLIPWIVAGVVAVVASQILPGKWYILLGGLAGSLIGAWQYER